MESNQPRTALIAAYNMWEKTGDSEAANSLRQARPVGSRVKTFHRIMGFLNPKRFTPLTVSQTELRLKLHLEEFLELVEACGFRLEAPMGSMDYDDDKPTKFELIHIEGKQVDYIEVMDALADLTYVDYGHAICMGLDLDIAIQEVHASNMTKLGGDGKPIVNGETKGYRPGGIGMTAKMPEKGYNPDQPIGKGLKGPNYMKPQLAQFFPEIKQTLNERIK